MPAPEHLKDLHRRFLKAWACHLAQAQRQPEPGELRDRHCRFAWMYAALVLTVQGDDITCCLRQGR